MTRLEPAHGVPHDEPQADRVDRRQLAAVLRLVLGQMLRPGRDVSSGSKGHPLAQVVFSMSLFGLVFTQNAWRSADLASYLVLVFGCALVLVTFAVLPETQEARQRNAEVLSCRPVSPKTHLVARAVTLGVLGGLIGGCFGIVSLAGGSFRFGTSVAWIALFLLSLVVQGFVIAVFWVTFLLFALRRVSIARVRQVIQTLFLLIVLVVSLLSTGMIAQGRTFDAAAHPGLELLPSTWFARFCLPGSGAIAIAQRAGAMALVLLAIATALSRGLGRYYAEQQEKALAAEGDAVRTSRTVRLLHDASRSPLGRWLLAAPVGGLVIAIVTSTEREEISRLKTLALRLMVVVFFAVGLLQSGGFALAVLSYFLFSSTIDALDVIRQSSHAGASWILRKTPLRGAHLMRAVELAVFLRATAVPLALLTALAFVRLDGALAALIALGAFFAARAALAATLVVWPSMPLEREQRSMQSFVSLAIGLFLGMAAGIVGGGLILAFGMARVIALAIGSMLLAGLVVATYALRYWAGLRLDALEYPH